MPDELHQCEWPKCTNREKRLTPITVRDRATQISAIVCVCSECLAHFEKTGEPLEDEETTPKN